MKKIGLILLLCVALFFLYLVWSYFASSTSDTLVVPTVQIGNNKSSPSNKNTQNFQEDILNFGKNKIDAVKSFIEQIPKTVSSAFNSAIDQTKNTTREKLNTILETTQAPYSSTISGVSGNPANGSTQAGGDSVQSSSTELQVCFIVSRGTLVDYRIDQPFPATQETLYKIEWGDGENINGLFHSGDKNVLVSHTYAWQGNYSAIFKLMSGSTTLTVSRSVCVK